MQRLIEDLRPIVSGPMVTLEWLADDEAYFLFLLLNDVNLEILKNDKANTDLHSFAHCALDGIVRQIARPNDSGIPVPVQSIPDLAKGTGRFLYTKFKELFSDALLLTAAIDELSEIYFGGEDVLFDDSRAILDGLNSNLRKTVEIYAPMALWLDLEPVTIETLKLNYAVLDAKATALAEFSRAEVAIRS